MVITLELYKEIRKKRLNGMSQRQIAAALHISRNTVKKYWDGENVSVKLIGGLRDFCEYGIISPYSSG